MDTELSLICIVGKKVKEFFPLYLFVDTWLDVLAKPSRLISTERKTQGVYTQLAGLVESGKVRRGR